MEHEARANDYVLQRAQAGDVAAFGTMVRAHQRSVFSLSVRMLGDRHKAEDVAQEVFLQLHRKLAAIESDSHLAFWLRQVTLRKSIDRLRREPQNEVDLSAAEHCETGASDGDPILQQQLRLLVGKLSPDARAVLLLRYQEDLDPIDIARALDMSINTVKSHLKRSLAFLREQTLGDSAIVRAVK